LGGPTTSLVVSHTGSSCKETDRGGKSTGADWRLPETVNRWRFNVAVVIEVVVVVVVSGAGFV